MLNIDNILNKLILQNYIKKYAILIASIMFIWSGFNKIQNFDKKVNTLSNKINSNYIISSIAMILVIILEIIGFLFLISYFFNNDFLYNIFNQYNFIIKLSHKQLIQIILLSLLLFLIVVTIIYHPFSFNHPIPFLSNLTTFGLFLYVYSDL